MAQTDFSNLPDRWTLILTRPHGGVVGKFGDPWERCPEEFPRINVRTITAEDALSKDQVRTILSAAGIDPDLYERAQQALRDAVLCGVDLAAAAPLVPAAEPAPAVEAVEALPEIVKPLNELPIVPAEVVKPLIEESKAVAGSAQIASVDALIASGIMEPVGTDNINPAVMAATMHMALGEVRAKEPQTSPQGALF